ncbi:serine protease, S1-C subfamily, contains C-terminal PDZ domain [Pseudonocardia thermophila]|uniref:Serine protease, S1-C subfamily, contains C-terminal PDZ domain n=2 Tax=Pseudonocardia thermophila TaxID=1848 RepID=A0A1M6RK06_PSETH|nr:serine protease, S1-C subfamily, contains C-terminal PDZ domain [Pseudonocardia thermophila]
MAMHDREPRGRTEQLPDAPDADPTDGEGSGAERTWPYGSDDAPKTAPDPAEVGPVSVDELLSRGFGPDEPSALDELFDAQASLDGDDPLFAELAAQTPSASVERPQRSDEARHESPETAASPILPQRVPGERRRVEATPFGNASSSSVDLFADAPADPAARAATDPGRRSTTYGAAAARFAQGVAGSERATSRPATDLFSSGVPEPRTRIGGWTADPWPTPPEGTHRASTDQKSGARPTGTRDRTNGADGADGADGARTEHQEPEARGTAPEPAERPRHARPAEEQDEPDAGGADGRHRSGPDRASEQAEDRDPEAAEHDVRDAIPAQDRPAERAREKEAEPVVPEAREPVDVEGPTRQHRGSNGVPRQRSEDDGEAATTTMGVIPAPSPAPDDGPATGPTATAPASTADSATTDPGAVPHPVPSAGPQPAGTPDGPVATTEPIFLQQAPPHVVTQQAVPRQAVLQPPPPMPGRPARLAGRTPGWPVLAAAAAAAAILAGMAGGAIGYSLASRGPDPAAEASAGQGTVEQVAAKVLPSVVQLRANGASDTTGSAVVLRPDGLLLTNNHVVEQIGSRGLVVQLQDGRTAQAKLVGRDPNSDLALVQAQGLTGLVPAELGDSSSIAVGQQVVAVGSPLGLGGTVTTGVVSALDRAVTVGPAQGARTQTVLNAVQTDAAINPGNSGGPLVDMAGRVIGINSAIATTGPRDGSIGVGFAVPINQAKRVADELERTGKAARASAGLTVATDSRRTGAVVRTVAAGGPADRAGIAIGDVVVRIDDRPVLTGDDLQAAIGSRAPGEVVRIELSDRTVEVTLDAAS